MFSHLIFFNRYDKMMFKRLSEQSNAKLLLCDRLSIQERLLGRRLQSSEFSSVVAYSQQNTNNETNNTKNSIIKMFSYSCVFFIMKYGALHLIHFDSLCRFANSTVPFSI